jgi:hypothetical protein
MKSCSWVVVLLVSLVLLAPAAFAGEAAAGAASVVSAGRLPPMPLFDKLRPEADVIYLLASSSVVFGPDPNARSEEITFVGFVTVPKWPMPGYERRILPSGRQEIDLELTESELVGESYLLGGQVNLGEHPDLRSLGTITERDKRPQARPAAEASPAPAGLGRPASSGIALASYQAAGAKPQASSNPANRTEAVRFTFPVTENLEKLIERNPYVLWDDLIAGELRKLLEGQRNLAGAKPRIVPPPNAQLIEWSASLPADLARRMGEQKDVDWRGYLYQSAELVAADLLERQVIQADGESFNPALIPNDFVVARKVLITTAKGILYNETPVPVRGQINAIPPVKTSQTPVGVNVFHGMELPVALLDEEGEINGWFYSKAHMAYAVKPDAIQRHRLRATAELKRDGRTERVALEGPMEIHHNKNGAKVDGEVIVLALRGKSELLGGEVMMIESFSDRERLSSGPLVQRGAGADWDFDLFLEVYTPSDKLVNEKPLHLAGSFGEIRNVKSLAKGNLSIPLLAGVASRPFVSTRGGELYNEAGKPVAEMVHLELEIAD